MSAVLGCMSPGGTDIVLWVPSFLPACLPFALSPSPTRSLSLFLSFKANKLYYQKMEGKLGDVRRLAEGIDSTVKK